LDYLKILNFLNTMFLKQEMNCKVLNISLKKNIYFPNLM
jgi:hypothetical protein